MGKLCHWICNLYCKLTKQPTSQETLAALVNSIKEKTFQVDVSDRIKIQRQHKAKVDELNEKNIKKHTNMLTASSETNAAKISLDSLTRRKKTLERSVEHQQRLSDLNLEINKLDKKKKTICKIDPNLSMKECLATLEAEFKKSPLKTKADKKELQKNLQELDSLDSEISKSQSFYESLLKTHETAKSEYVQVLQEQKNLRSEINSYNTSRLNAKLEKIKRESEEKIAKINQDLKRLNAMSDALTKINRGY